MEEIFGMVNLLGNKSTVSEILSDIFLGMYVLWHLKFSKACPMYQPGSPCDAH